VEKKESRKRMLGKPKKKAEDEIDSKDIDEKKDNAGVREFNHNQKRLKESEKSEMIIMIKYLPKIN
jgi:hypothetical protein